MFDLGRQFCQFETFQLQVGDEKGVMRYYKGAAGSKSLYKVWKHHTKYDENPHFTL
jgi:hypothetical protein